MQTAKPLCTHSNDTVCKKCFLKKNKHSFYNTNRRDANEQSWGNADKMVHRFDRNGKTVKMHNAWCTTVTFIQQRKGTKGENIYIYFFKSTFVFGHVHDQWGVTGKITSKKEVKFWRVIKAKNKKKEKKWFWMIPNQRKRSPSCFQGQIQSVCTNMPTFHENTVFTTGLANGLGGLLLLLLAANVVIVNKVIF